jgi:hypothetical protein
MTNVIKSPKKYTLDKSNIRESLLARLLGLESLIYTLAHTPKKSSTHPRVLVSSNELLFTSFQDYNKTAEILMQYFTHLVLVVADSEPKKSALKIIQKSQTSELPIIPLVWANSTSTNLKKTDIEHLHASPILSQQTNARNVKMPTVNIIKKSGTGMDRSSFNVMKQNLSTSPFPLLVMNQNLTINHSRPYALPSFMSVLAMHHIATLGTHPSETIGALTGNPPDQILLAIDRGAQEQRNRLWISQFYDKQDIQGAGNNLTHLISRDTTRQELYDAVSHLNPMTEIAWYALAN